MLRNGGVEGKRDVLSLRCNDKTPWKRSLVGTIEARFSFSIGGSKRAGGRAAVPSTAGCVTAWLKQSATPTILIPSTSCWLLLYVLLLYLHVTTVLC